MGGPIGGAGGVRAHGQKVHLAGGGGGGVLRQVGLASVRTPATPIGATRMLGASCLRTAHVIMCVCVTVCVSEGPLASVLQPLEVLGRVRACGLWFAGLRARVWPGTLYRYRSLGS